jgi:NTE family protein
MRYFDSRDTRITLKHVLASGALPPAFPAVRIDGDLYWDGGVLSNTPVEAIFDDMPRRDSIIFAVHIWRSHGAEPGTIWEVMSRQKDLQYSSRAVSHIARQKQIHRLRHIITALAERLPKSAREDPEVRALASYGCVTTMHVVRLVAPMIDGDDHTKDIDFSRAGIRRRRQAGREDTLRILERKPWTAPHDPLDGFVLHQPELEPLDGRARPIAMPGIDQRSAPAIPHAKTISRS